MNTQNVETMFSMVTDDALIIGSDPSENWTKEEVKSMWIDGKASYQF